MSVVGVILMAGTFNLSEIVTSQQGFHLGIRAAVESDRLARCRRCWDSFCYFIAAVAETNRAPFDLAEAESELVAGFHTEYSSFKFAMFFMAEYASMITVSCLATILFFGGWLSPFPQTPLLAWTHYIPAAVFVLAGLALDHCTASAISPYLDESCLPVLGLVLVRLALLCGLPGVIDFIQGPFWFLLKIAIFLFVYVWVRGTLPRFRYDQLMGFGWKLLLPLSLVNVVITSLALVLTQR